MEQKVLNNPETATDGLFRGEGRIFSEKEVFSFDNYVFDLYGTLIDLHTDEWITPTWKKWFKVLREEKIKHPFLKKFRKQFFDLDRAYRLKDKEHDFPEVDVVEILDELFTSYGNRKMTYEEIFDISYSFRAASIEYIKLFDSVTDFLKKLHEKGKKVYILSNAQKSYTLYELQNFGLDKLVDDYLLSSDYKVMKPEKEFYDALVTKHNLDRSKTVMIGDSYENDYKGALNAGLNAIWLGKENVSGKFYKRYI